MQPTCQARSSVLNFANHYYKMATSTLPNLENLTLCDPVVTKAGGKACALLSDEGPILLNTNALHCPFDVTGFNDPEAVRVNLCLDADSDLIEWTEKLDAAILKLAQRESKRLFGDYKMECELKGSYFSPLKKNEKYGNCLFKSKLWKAGKQSVRVWNKAGFKCEMPDSWQGLQVQTRMVLKSLWIQGRSFGLTFETLDVMIVNEAAPETCPFTSPA
jgi:hypothetical protein